MKKLLMLILACLPMLAMAAVHPAHVRKMEAEFKQTRSSEMTAQDVITTGTFRYNADANLLTWNYDDGSDWKMSVEMMAVLRRVLQGKYEKSNSDFDAREDGATLILTPKKKNLKALYKEIQIRFNPFTGYLQEMMLIETTGTEPDDPRGDIIVVEFRNVEVAD